MTNIKERSKWTEERLDQLLTEPDNGLIKDLQTIDGDIMLIGAGGKMGSTLSIMARRALDMVGDKRKVIAVSRFTDPAKSKILTDNGVEIISCDLLDFGAVDSLPKSPNVIFMAGRKFGTTGQEAATWAMNAMVPSLVARHFRDSRIVVFSSGNIYPLVKASTGGCDESVAPVPIGEYAMSTLARERVFEHAAKEWGTKVLMYRLNFAVDLRYGVLNDIAQQILAEQPIELGVPAFNVIWQGYASSVALRSLLLADSPAKVLNVTGSETVSVRYAAKMLAKHLSREVSFVGTEDELGFLSNSAQCYELFGPSPVGISQLIRWQAEWLMDGGRSLGLPTHFEQSGGKF